MVPLTLTLSRWERELFFFSSRRRHTRLVSDWSSDVCSSDLEARVRRRWLGARRRKHGFCALRPARRRSARGCQEEAKETPPGGLARGHFSGDRTRQAKLSAFPEVRRVPLSTYFRRRAAEVEERNFARDTLAPRRHSLGWPDSRARGGAVWLPQSRAMGGARRDAARAGIFFARELPDPAN